MVDGNLLPRRCRAMLAQHLLPHDSEPREVARSLDCEQVFADYSLLLN